MLCIFDFVKLTPPIEGGIKEKSGSEERPVRQRKIIDKSSPRRNLRGVFLGAALAAAMFQPIAAHALSQDEARHLALRTGYSVMPGGGDPFLPLSRAEAVDRVLGELRTTPSLAPPAWIDELPGYSSSMTTEQRQARDTQRAQQRSELVAWWYLEMASTPSPLTEKLVLFWHNHFVSAQSKVNSAQMMYRQNQLFRRLGSASFADLLGAIVRDPAMLIYLDNNRNVVRAPNENLARELMELFTLGVGNYTETDVKEVARALTGNTVVSATEAFLFDAKNHDNTNKTILGKTGNWGDSDVVRILLEQPAAARFIVTKLWLEFISPTPDAAQVEQFAQVLRSQNYAMRPLLRAMLTSDAFWAPANRAAIVKAPAELLVQTLRALSLPTREAMNLPSYGRQMGQDLFNPPNVKGWPGNTAWINTQTLPARQSFVQTAVNLWKAEVAPAQFGVTAKVVNGKPQPLVLPNITADQQKVLNARFLAASPVYKQPVAPVEASTALRAILLDAAYQTK